MELTTLEEQCRDRIIALVPIIRQTNAALYGEHKEYVQTTITLLRNHFYQLEASGATEWTDPDLSWVDENRPYNI